MKKFIFNVLALLAVCTAGNAQIAGLNIGYCNGEVSTSIHKEFCSQEKDVWVSGAIWLPASDINVNAGNELRAIRAGLAQKIGIDTMSVWVRETLDGANIAEGGIAKSSVKKGWNEIELNQAIALDGTNTTGYYIGYSYHQTSVNQGLSVFLTPTPNALFLKHGDGEWTDRSAEGLLCVEGLVYGDNLPKLNLRLISVDAPEYYIIDKGKMTVEDFLSAHVALIVLAFNQPEVTTESLEENLEIADVVPMARELFQWLQAQTFAKLVNLPNGETEAGE